MLKYREGEQGDARRHSSARHRSSARVPFPRMTIIDFFRRPCSTAATISRTARTETLKRAGGSLPCTGSS